MVQEPHCRAPLKIYYYLCREMLLPKALWIFVCLFVYYWQGAGSPISQAQLLSGPLNF